MKPHLFQRRKKHNIVSQKVAFLFVITENNRHELGRFSQFKQKPDPCSSRPESSRSYCTDTVNPGQPLCSAQPSGIMQFKMSQKINQNIRI